MANNSKTGNENTIIALASARGNGALAIFRMSGEGCFAVMERCVQESEKFLKAKHGKIQLYHFVDCEKKEMVDEVTVIKYNESKSYTGETMVELICHGGEVIIDKVYDVVTRAGGRIAGPGEFTRRAVENGKINVLKAESIDVLIRSRNAEAVKSALGVYAGELGKFGAKIRDELVEVFSEIETELEFGEEHDVGKTGLDSWTKRLESITVLLDNELKKREKVKLLDNGVTLAIVGDANVGKSTLFNLLLNNERSLVHHDGGTTRDYVTEQVVFCGMRVKFVDTAGLRNAAESVEKLGIEKGRQKSKGAQIVIIVTTGNANPENIESIMEFYKGRRVGVVVNKSDLFDPQKMVEHCLRKGYHSIGISLLSEIGKREAEKMVELLLRELYGQSDEGTLLVTTRQEQAVSILKEKIEQIVADKFFGGEIISLRLKEALASVDALVGNVSDGDVLDRIFSRFCIGK